MSDEEKKSEDEQISSESEKKNEDKINSPEDKKQGDENIIEKNPEEERAETKNVIPEKFENEGKNEIIELPNKNIKTGMVVRVHEKIKDTNSKGEEKERIQIFEGLVIGVKSSGPSRTMTVRKNSKGWMVEKIFPLSSPIVEKIEVVKVYKTRRAKLSFLRGRFRRKLREQK